MEQSLFEADITALIAFTKIEDDLLEIVRGVTQLKGWFPTKDGMPTFSEVGPGCLILPPSWEDIVTRRTHRCIMTVGGKNSGKSTLTRHLINAHISSGSPVCFVDLDPGQAEFSTPGLISSYDLEHVVLHNGMFGNTLQGTHHWIGETSSKEDPRHYLACISNLLQRASVAEGTIIINTPGWIKGTGMEILLEIMNMLDSHFPQEVRILHLGTSALRQRIPPHIHCDDIEQQFSQFSNNAADLRIASLMMYFHRRGDSWSRILNDGHYWELSYAPSTGVITGVAIMRDEIDQTEVFAALSGTIVALLRVKDFDESGFQVNYGDDSIGIIQTGGEPIDPTKSICIGLAIVAGINFSTQTLSLITPISLNTFQALEDSDDKLILSTGSIEVPIQALTSNDTITFPRPYLTNKPGEGIGWQSWHVRRNIGRRR